MSNIKIGWIGIGNIGKPMVKNLVLAGFEVSAYNRTRDKAEALQREIDIDIVDDPAHLMADSDIIITMLSDDAAVTEVFTGADGLLNAAPGKQLLCIDMSTVSPETTRKLAALCAEKGIAYMDAPVSGSVKPAENRELIIMAGGTQADFERAEPVFKALGKQWLYMGEHGAGNKAKLAVNLILAIQLQGLLEGVLFAQQNGVDAAQLLQVINNGAVGSGVSRVKTEPILQQNFVPAFYLKHMVKDLNLAEAQGMHLPAGKAALESYRRALEEGLGDEDMIAVMKSLQKLA